MSFRFPNRHTVVRLPHIVAFTVYSFTALLSMQRLYMRAQRLRVPDDSHRRRKILNVEFTVHSWLSALSTCKIHVRRGRTWSSVVTNVAEAGWCDHCRHKSLGVIEISSARLTQPTGYFAARTLSQICARFEFLRAVVVAFSEIGPHWPILDLRMINCQRALYPWNSGFCGQIYLF